MSNGIDSLIALIRRLAAEGNIPSTLASQPLSGETRIHELGLDSLGWLELVTALTEESGAYLPDDALSETMTLAEVAAVVAEKLGAA